ncbi:bifunctional diaminohydroxyphosphoribosylaminopyrimidine deaminase/5-amino-6-(5-phosphoribosylamino)uracil reductase RibD, partial [Trichothermofontia sp.]
VGEGYHPAAGQPHAEVFALQAAGDRAQGATLYVNLEPCSHYGRTPPCADAVIAAGIQRVVIGMEDPNPLVAGRGIARLRVAGLTVVVGVEQADCLQLNEAFVYRMRYQRPFGIFKYAMTLDGKIAASSGHSQWVTGSEARAWVYHLRSRCDAIIVGGNTVRRDNPHLTTHGYSAHTPRRVVLSRHLDLPMVAHLWQTDVAPTLVYTQPTANPEVQSALRSQGVEVICLDPVTPDAVMADLYDRGCLSVLWECGGQLAAQAVAEGAIQKVYAFVAPKLMGGLAAPTPIGELGFTQMTQALMLKNIQVRSIGPDILIEGYLSPPERPR